MKKSWVILLVILSLIPIPAYGKSDPVEWNPSIQQKTSAFLEQERKQNQIPGVAIAVVKEGKVVWSEGFGWADQEEQKPVDPAKTLFPVASISKVFTTVAVMQQVEQGNLDLHQDVNRYLKDWSVPPGEAPLTLHHLLTHTGGLEDVTIPLAPQTPDDLWSVREIMENRGLRRVDPPGKWIHYSNDGINLAGHLVEQVSDQPFEEYVAQSILAPLGMKSSTFHQVLPPDLKRNRTVGYHMGPDKTAVPNPPSWYHGGPDGTLSTTAQDMAAFMQTVMEKPTAGEESILQPATWERILSRQFSSHPELPGIGYGFFEMKWKEKTAWIHEGGLPDASSLLAVLPEERLGVFLVHNMTGFDASDFNHQVMDYLLTQLYPSSEKTAPAPVHQGSAEEWAAYEGDYRAKGPFTIQGDALKLWNLIPQFQNHIRLGEEGVLRLGDTPLIPLGDDRFAPEGRSYELAFGREEDGHVQMLYTGSPIPLMKSWERIPWVDDHRLHWALWGMILAVSITAAWVLPIQRWLRKRKHGKTARPAVLSRLACAVGWLQLLFIGCIIVYFFIPAIQDPFWGPFRYGVPLPLRIAGFLPFAAALLSLWLAIQSFRTWSRLGIIQRGESIAVSLIGVGMIAYLAYWNWLSLPWL